MGSKSVVQKEETKLEKERESSYNSVTPHVEKKSSKIPATVTDKQVVDKKSEKLKTSLSVSRKRSNETSKVAQEPSAKKMRAAPLHPAFPLLNAHAQAQREAGRKVAQLHPKPASMPATSPIRRQAPQPVQLPKGLQQKHGPHNQYMINQKGALTMSITAVKTPQAATKDNKTGGESKSSTILQVPMAATSLHYKSKSHTTSQKNTPPSPSTEKPTGSSGSSSTPVVQHKSLPQIVQPRQSGHSVQPKFAQHKPVAQPTNKNTSQPKQKPPKSSTTKHNPQTVRARLNAQHQQQQQQLQLQQQQLQQQQQQQQQHQQQVVPKSPHQHHNLPAQLPTASHKVQVS